VLEGEVDHAVGTSRGSFQLVEVIEIAAENLGTHRGDGLGGGIGAGKAHDLMAVAEELGDDGGGDVA
jgi:hypothetical protein